MNLIEQAEKDLSFTMEDKNSGFGFSVVLISPDLIRYGDNQDLIANKTDIGFFIEPGTDVGERGRQIEVCLRISTLINLGAGIPDRSGWTIEIENINEDKWVLEILEAPVDRQIGLVKCFCGVVDVSEN